jgi:hypothetical protein
MSSFAEDIAQNRGIKTKEPTKPSAPVVLVTDAKFFARRDKDNIPIEEFSQRTWDGLFANCAEHRIVICIADEDSWIRDHVQPGDRWEFFRIKYDSIGETTIRLRVVLSDLGLQFRPIRNPRTVSFLNIQKFVVGDFTLLGTDDHEKVGLAPDKDLSFQDLANLRRKSAWP